MNDNLEKTTSPEKLWKSCLLYIKDKISDQAFQTWFSGILISSVSNDELVIQVPNKFHFEWLESKYRMLIEESINHVTSKSLIINYTVPITSKSDQEIPSFTNK